MKTMMVMGVSVKTGELEVHEVRQCDSKDCLQPASISIAWTGDRQCACVSCARALIEVGRIMGFFTPEHTARLMTKSEILMNDELPDSIELARIKDKLELHRVLYGE